MSCWFSFLSFPCSPFPFTRTPSAVISPSPSFLPHRKARWRLAAAAGVRDRGASPAPAPALACPRRCPRPGRPHRGRGSARPPRARLAVPGRCPRLCGRAPRAEPPPPAAPGLCVRAPGAGSWVFGAVRPGAGGWVRGARGAGPEAGSSAAEAMSGSSGGATAPAASSGPAAAASAAGSGCGGGAGEGAEEAAKDLADIAAFFRSGEYRGCPTRSAGPARPDLRPGTALRALVPVAASGLCDPLRRVRLPTPPVCCSWSRAPSLAFPALAPRARLDTPRSPAAATTAPRVGAPALCFLLEGRGGGGGDGVGGGRCPGGRAHRDWGQQLCPVIAFGPLIAGPPTSLSASVLAPVF